MRAILLLLGVCLVIFAARADSASLNQQAGTLFAQGNSYYAEEKFDQAIVAYEQELSLGRESGPLYYNLGNAYFKSGQLGRSILNYLRAERLIPADADLKANLNYARSLIQGGKIYPQKRWFVRLFSIFADSFSLDSLAVLTTVLYFTLSLLVMGAILLKKLRKRLIYVCAAAGTILAIYSGAFFIQLKETLGQNKAVVVVKSAEAKFEPLADATTFFSLPEGEDVAVLVEKEGWLKARRPDGKQGWIKKTELGFL